MGLVASCAGFLDRRSPPPPPATAPSTTTDSSPPPIKVSGPDLERVFGFLDANGDGRISAAEMSEFYGCTDEQEAKEMVAAADSDGDGFISKEELRAVMEGGDASDTLRGAFDEFDENKDGVITAEELGRVLRRLGIAGAELTAEQCEQMVAAYDGNGDGVINFDEFKAMMAAKPAP